VLIGRRRNTKLDARRLCRIVLVVATLNQSYFFVEFTVALVAGSVPARPGFVDGLARFSDGSAAPAPQANEKRPLTLEDVGRRFRSSGVVLGTYQVGLSPR
jgi:hypothetical protein